MRTIYTYLNTLFIWSTWKRQELTDSKTEPKLSRLVTEKVIEKNFQLIRIEGTENHIHEIRLGNL